LSFMHVSVSHLIDQVHGSAGAAKQIAAVVLH